MAASVTAMVITFNEEANIGRVLERLTWAKEVLIIDSGSTDATLTIATGHGNVRVVSRPFDTFADQCNFGLDQVSTDWVLSLDADYVLTEPLVAEILALSPSLPVCGYRTGFRYRIFERVLRGALYPRRVVLYRRDKAHYHNLGHSHAVKIDGAVADLAHVIWHDDRKPLSRWLASQAVYARREADYLLSTPRSQLNFADRLRLAMAPAPVLAPLYALFVKGCLFDGLAGWCYVLQRMFAECAIALELADRRLRGSVTGAED